MDNDKYIGRLLDNRYEILEVIGVGGMAVVYKARCHRLNRLVAVKILKDDYSQDDEFRRRFHAEGQAVAMVSHPNIVSVYDVSTSNEADYIVMELIDGISLKQYMEKKGVLNWKETLHFAIQIGKALEHAHSRGIVHRDIKPHNVMVLKNGSVKVADFGIARVMSESNTLTREALGSVHYISPEQAKGGRVDNRSDLYSLGVVMYEMMTGRPPYNGESPVAVAIQHINGGAVMPSTINPNIPGGLEQIIMKAMAHEPANRYNSATAMLYDMDEFRKDPTILFDYNIPPTDAVIQMNRQPEGTSPARQPRPAAVPVPRNTGAIRPQTGEVSRNTGALRTQQPRAQAPARNTGPVRTQQPRAQAPARNTGPLRTTGPVRSTGPVRPENRGTGPLRTAAAQVPQRPTTADRVANGNRRPAQPGQTPQRRRREEEKRDRSALVAIICCSVVAFIALVLFLFFFLSSSCNGSQEGLIEVPNFLGCDYNETYNTYKYRTDLKILLNSDRSYSYSEEYAENQIMDQTPKAGEQVTEGTKIYVTVSMGKEPEIKTMVDHAGKTEAEVRAYLDGQELQLNIQVETEVSSEVEEGKVIRTVPAAGETITEGSVVTIFISSGPEKVEIPMPDLKNMTVEEAVKKLEDQKLNLTIKQEPREDLTVEENTVVASKPSAGDPVKTGDEVILYVAFGMKTNVMPDVTGKSEADAKKELATFIKDLELTVKVEEGYEEGKPLDKVFKTSPAMNETIKTGDTVTLYICTAQKGTMPNVKGKNVDVAKEMMKVNKLEKVKVEYQASNEAKDTVLSQSVEAGTEVALDTEIVLVVSGGPRTVSHTFALGQFMNGATEAVTLQVVNLSTGQVVKTVTVQPNETSFTVELTGNGKTEFQVSADGIPLNDIPKAVIEFAE